MSTTDICPLCNRSLRIGMQTAGRRICCLCGNPIRKRHKYRIGSNGLLQHRDCQMPTGDKMVTAMKGIFDE
jgi:hypothetical protein